VFRPLSLAIGLRYIRAKRRNRFISFISAASMLGIVIGVMALITVISVMNGFEQELRNRILGMVAHATISGAGEPLHDWQHAVELAHTDPRVIGAAPYAEREAMLQGAQTQGALLRGVLPEREPDVSQLADKMIAGRLDDLKPGAFNILLGKELALWLGVDVGDAVTAFVPEFRTTPVGVLPQLKRFTVVGIFEAGVQDYDLGLGVIHLRDAQKLMRLGDGVTGVRLRLTDLMQGYEVAHDLAARLPDVYRVRDWSRDHANFFRAIKLEKTMMFLVVSLIVAVAAFNLVSSLVMLVTDKQADIAILRTLGAAPASITRIFMIQGTLIGVVGTLLGLAGGIALALNVETVVPFIEAVLGIKFLSKDVYYISDLPSELQLHDVVITAVVSFALSLAATIYPSWRAAKINPAEALRYE